MKYKTTEQFVIQAKSVHGNKYDYSKVNYIGAFDKVCIICPEGYIFKDENGNVINAQKITLENKKKEYPKTYEECLKFLGYDDRETYCVCHTGADERLFEALYRLKVCRDAYWKIAGEEMGLNDPWEPDFDNLSTNLEYMKIVKGCFTYSSKVFVFPTTEMLDAFKENFDPDIEICKELL